ncbi:hypothetical protein HD806DRAFT_551934 [Xylariaceae sp. AK1471]|nr:hypothetical protein HD806DRAFT_551934 [Xylariaceae sp. AK1471]
MSNISVRHRDAFGRVTRIAKERVAQEHYLRPSDGRLAPLLVQGTNESYGYGETPERGSWLRTGRPKMRISAILRLVRWTYSAVFEEGSENRHFTAESLLVLAFKWIPSCVILVLMLFIPQNLEGTTRNGGFYDPVQNRNEGQHQDYHTSDEPGEDRPLLNGDIEMTAITHPTPASGHGTQTQETEPNYDDLPVRHFGPRFLCFLQDGPRGRDMHYETRSVAEVLRKHGDHANTDFVFVSYTRRQFRVDTEEELRRKNSGDEAKLAAYVSQAKADRDTLIEYGMEAARSAGKRAFWLDFECIRDIDNVARADSQSNDVYRICDIVRAAHSLVIVVGPPIGSRLPGGEQQAYSPTAMEQWLQEWGMRLWTLPEILLCSPEHRVKLYAIGGPMPPEEIAKRKFPGRAVWSDAKLVRQLIDHYESSIHLTPLELVSIALECFSGRQTHQFSNGDIAYALMGLLRRRPAVDKSDTSFEAFARLSLANDSDRLLERLICMQPTRSNAPWHEIADAWGARLWDIEPRCQVAGIVDDQTVTLDGAFGATIQWDRMDQVAFFKRPTLGRLIGKILLRGAPVYLLFGLVLTIAAALLKQQLEKPQSQHGSTDRLPDMGESDNSGSNVALGLLIPGIIVLVLSAIIVLWAPAMLLNIYAGKFWSTQALFLGMEGIPANIGDVERHLFGFNHGRLKWSTAGSTLSRHVLSSDGECVALSPKVQARSKDSAAIDSDEDTEGTLFTLVDTFTMTATAFRAARPPTAVIICGQEGGMQRAVLASYDWRHGTFAREAVIRIKTLALDRMFRVDRFRFALRRKTYEVNEIGDNGHNLSTKLLNIGDEFGEELRRGVWRRWRIDLALLPLMWFVFGLAPKSSTQGGSSAIMYLGFVVVQLFNFVLFQRLKIGHVIATATLVKSSLAIVQASTDLSLPSSIAISAFQGAADGVILPACVYLTGTCYGGTRGQVLRIIIWASGRPFYEGLTNTLLKIEASPNGLDLTRLVWGGICILLSAYAYIFIGTPGQVTWLPRTEHGLQIERIAAVSKTLKKPQTYFLFGTALLSALLNSAPDPLVSRLNYVEKLPDVVSSSILPTLVMLAVGVLFIVVPHFRMLIICAVASIGFSGYVTIAEKLDNGYIQSSMADGLAFLTGLGYFSTYLIWALLLSDIFEPGDLLVALCIGASGYGLGGIITGGFWSTIWPINRQSNSNRTPNYELLDTGILRFLSVIFAILVAVLLLWSVYYWWAKRSQPDDARPIPIHQQVVDDQPVGYGEHVTYSQHPNYRQNFDYNPHTNSGHVDYAQYSNYGNYVPESHIEQHDYNSNYNYYPSGNVHVK